MKNYKRNIVIVGCGSIGQKIARKLQQSHNINIIDIKKNSALNVIQCDLISSIEVEKVFKNLSKENHRIDILIFAAGKVSFQAFHNTKIEEVFELLNANYITVINCLLSATKYLKRSKHPLIVNMNSIAELSSFANNSIYAASKVATSKLLEIYAEENRSIRITQLYLGAVKSRVWTKYPKFNQRNMISPNEIASMVYWLVNHSHLLHIPKVQMIPLKGIL
jgi:short-subunit dehydrogenase